MGVKKDQFLIFLFNKLNYLLANKSVIFFK